MASMTEHEVAALQLMKAENELRQLRFENQWLRDANKTLREQLEAEQKFPPEALV